MVSCYQGGFQNNKHRQQNNFVFMLKPAAPQTDITDVIRMNEITFFILYSCSPRARILHSEKQQALFQGKQRELPWSLLQEILSKVMWILLVSLVNQSIGFV